MVAFHLRAFLARICAAHISSATQSAEQRRLIRQMRALPLLNDLHTWLHAMVRKLRKKSALAGAIGYSLSRWSSLMRYCGAGRIEIDNNTAERALRTVALGRKNFLFAGSASGGDRAAAFYSLIGTAKLNGLDPGGLPARRLHSHRRSSHQSDRGTSSLESRAFSTRRDQSLRLIVQSIKRASVERLPTVATGSSSSTYAAF